MSNDSSAKSASGTARGSAGESNGHGQSASQGSAGWQPAVPPVVNRRRYPASTRGAPAPGSFSPSKLALALNLILRPLTLLNIETRKNSRRKMKAKSHIFLRGGCSVGYALATIAVAAGLCVAFASASSAVQSAPAAAPSPVSAEAIKLVNMSEAGVSQPVLKSYAENCTIYGQPTADDIIYLHNHGISSDVITALIQRATTLRQQSLQAAQAMQASREMAAAYPSAQPAPAATTVQVQPAPYPVYVPPTYVEYPVAYPYYVYSGYPYYGFWFPNSYFWSVSFSRGHFFRDGFHGGFHNGIGFRPHSFAGRGGFPHAGFAGGSGGFRGGFSGGVAMHGGGGGFGGGIHGGSHRGR